MKMTIEIDCTPVEARAFLGLPDVSALNDHLVKEMQDRMDSNMAMLAPEELMKNWMAFGAGAQEQFRKLMTAAAGAAVGGMRRQVGMNDTIFAPATRPGGRRWPWCASPARDSPTPSGLGGRPAQAAPAALRQLPMAASIWTTPWCSGSRDRPAIPARTAPSFTCTAAGPWSRRCWKRCRPGPASGRAGRVHPARLRERQAGPGPGRGRGRPDRRRDRGPAPAGAGPARWRAEPALRRLARSADPAWPCWKRRSTSPMRNCPRRWRPGAAGSGGLERRDRRGLADASRGRRVRDGFRIALVGAPNAGKSTC
jgi:hypothetical protein